jgi:hypothetical protein
MIGGIDIRIPTRAGDSSLEVSVRAIRQKWPGAIYENGLTGDRYDHFRQIPFGDVEELFVYRDSAAAELWDIEGAVPNARNSMIHVIADQDMLTAVIDERDAEMDGIIAAIRSGLADELFYIPAFLGAA